MPHICVGESGQHWFRWWLVTCSAPSHYLNQYWAIVNWTLRNKLQWNFHQNTYLFIDENASENIVCETAAILSMWVTGVLQCSAIYSTHFQSENKKVSVLALRHVMYGTMSFGHNVSILIQDEQASRNLENTKSIYKNIFSFMKPQLDHISNWSWVNLGLTALIWQTPSVIGNGTGILWCLK